MRCANARSADTENGALAALVWVSNGGAVSGLSALYGYFAAGALVKLLSLLLLLPFTATAQTGSATLSWQPSIQNTDGTPLKDLAATKVYWGTAPTTFANSAMINNASASSYVVDQLTAGTWYFAVTAINSVGAESGKSNVVSKTIQGNSGGPVTLGGPCFNPAFTTDHFLPLEVCSVVAGKACDPSQQLTFGGKTYMAVVNAQANVTPLPGMQVVLALAQCQ